MAALSAGASLAGTASLETLRDLPSYGGVDLSSFKSAVSYCVALPDYAVDLITVRDPGNLYAWAYKTANMLLDQIGMRVAGAVAELGGKALAVPSSLRIDPELEVGNVSHKAFALAAGLGWIGRNGLFIAPKFGPRVRLGTVLTDLPLRSGTPMENRCGDCRICIDSCPSKAIKYAEFRFRPGAREDIFDPKKCFSRLSENKELLSKKPGMADYAVTVCGVCMKVCPYGSTRR